MPNLLVAPSTDPQTNDDGDSSQDEYETGYYADGAYTATPTLTAITNGRSDLALPCGDNEPEASDPQELYYASLLARYRHLRTLLNQAPTTNSSAVGPSGTEAASLHNAKHAHWRHTILYTPPTSRVIAIMPQETLVRALARVETLLTRRNLLGKEGKNLGAWCWGLLARCRDVGEMGSEEVGVLREVGKKAVKVSQKLRIEGLRAEREELEMDDAEDHEEVEEDLHEADVRDLAKGAAEEGLGNGAMADEPGVNIANVSESDGPSMVDAVPDRASVLYESEERSLALAKQALLAQVSGSGVSSPPRDGERVQGNEKNGSDSVIEALATLDMIVTIVGELYGQRDLLDAREIWDEY